MAAFVGWHGGVSGAAPETIRGAFLRAAEGKAQSNILSQCGGICAWPASNNGVSGSTDLFCAILGDPRWIDPEIATVASRDGMAAALVEAYRRWDTRLLERLQGSFSLAVVDTKRNRVLAAIDRMGICSLCYARSPSGGLVFATTADLVVSHPSIEANVSPQAVYNFLRFYVSPATSTIWREVCKLKRSQLLLLEGGEIRVETYWHLAASEKCIDQAGFASELKRALECAVARTVQGEPAERVGAFLSGGVDSSTVAGYLRAVTGQQPRCFTIGFDQVGYDEVGYAESSARHYDARHLVYYLTPADVVASLPEIASAYDEPFGNSSAIPTYFCARLAKENGIELMLAGDGGDELFGGNERYVSYAIYERYRRLPASFRERFLERLVAALPDGMGFTPFRKAKNFIRNVRIGVPRLLYAQSFLHGETEFCEEFAASIDPEDPMRLIETEFNSSDSPSQIRRMMHLDLQLTLADNDLRKVGRMCALAGVRVRYPLLDDDLVRLSGRIPSTLLCNRGRLRYFYKNILRDFLPSSTLSKKKHGFGMPFFEWSHTYRPLSDLIGDAITRFRRRGYLRPAVIDRIHSDHRYGLSTPHSAAAWDVMMLELWFERHLFPSQTL
jgi:asparagine synthase (glutamine-hydrolysing)